MITTPFPEPEAPELERFVVYSRAEVISMLRQLRDQRIPLTGWHGVDGGFAVTAILDVRPDFDEVLCAAPEEGGDALLGGGPLVFVAFLEHVKLQFVAEAAEAGEHRGAPAIRLRLPEQVMRLQRRDYFRVRTPEERPAVCLVPWSREERQYESLRVLDISVGGVALVTAPEKVLLPADGVVEHCFLDLPGIGSLNVTLRLRHVRGADGAIVSGCGCEFVDLAPQARLMVQRYVNRLDATARRVEAVPANGAGAAPSTIAASSASPASLSSTAPLR